MEKIHITTWYHAMPKTGSAFGFSAKENVIVSHHDKYWCGCHISNYKTHLIKHNIKVVKVADVFQ